MIIYNYIITNLIDSKQYVGMHSTENINDGYLGSGILIKKAIKKYGKQNFKKEIICYWKTIEEAHKNEKNLIKKFNTLYPNGYNLSTTGGPFISKDFKIHLSKKMYGKKHTEETKRKISLGLIGKKHSEIHIFKVALKHKGKHLSEEHRLKLKNSSHKLRKKMSNEAKEHMLLARQKNYTSSRSYRKSKAMKLYWKKRKEEQLIQLK